MTQPQPPTVGDMIIDDMERQLGEPDPRYARKCRELAVLRAQYRQLMDFVQSKKDVLGLTAIDANGNPLDPPAEDSPAEPEAPAENAPVNGKVVAKDSTKPAP